MSNELQYANAFVIQFRAGAGFAKLAGRAEHVASGKTAVFQSIDDLPQLLRQMLRDVRLGPEAEEQPVRKRNPAKMDPGK